MSFNPRTRRKFSPGKKRQKDDAYCPVARSMIERHFGSTDGPQISADDSAGFGAHMLDCLACQQYYAALETDAEEKVKQGQS